MDYVSAGVLRRVRIDGAGVSVTDPVDGKPGYRIETASSVMVRDSVTNHFAQFHHVIRKDAYCGKTTVAAYVDALAGAVALTIAGGQGSKDETLDAMVAELRRCVERDLKHLKR